jgi:hypothetical protein
VIESSITGLDSVVVVPLAQVIGNILLAISIYCGVLSLLPKKYKGVTVPATEEKRDQTVPALGNGEKVGV